MVREDDLPWFWSVASAAVHLMFLAGALTTVWSSHFRSLDVLSQSASDALPRTLESSRPAWMAVAMLGAVALGVTASRRIGRGQWKPVAIRGAAIAFLPVVVELLAVGVQDGSPNDLDLVPPHSLALLVVAVVCPAVLAAFDLRLLRSAD